MALACSPPRPPTHAFRRQPIPRLPLPPLASHFSPPTRHAQSCGIKTQATGGGVAVHARGPAPGDWLQALSQPVCSRDFVRERTGYHLPSPTFNFTFLTVPYSYFSPFPLFFFSFLTRFDRWGWFFSSSWKNKGGGFILKLMVFYFSFLGLFQSMHFNFPFRL